MSDTQNPQDATPAAGRPYKKYAAIVLGLALAVGLFFAGRWYFTCPCDFTPGSVLWGEVVSTPVNDWSFANESELCQIQVNGPIIDHAVNLNCMATRQGELYLSCSQCEPKRWSRLALQDGAARIRLSGKVYPVQVTRVTDPVEADRSWVARLEKLENSTVPGSGTPVGTPRPSDEQWWTFRVVSRVN